MLLKWYAITLTATQTFLSSPPNRTTLEIAEAVTDKIDHPQEKKAVLTWNGILAEEPFEGQHWEGVHGLPPGSTVERWETRSSGSTPSLSPWDSESDLDESRPSSEIPSIRTPPPSERAVPQLATPETPLDPINAYRHRQDVEELQSRQYWRQDWHSDAAIGNTFDIGDASSLGKQSANLSKIKC